MNTHSSWFPVQPAKCLTYRNKTRKLNEKKKKNLCTAPLWRLPTLKKPWALTSDAVLSWLYHQAWVYPAPKWQIQLPGMSVEKKVKETLPDRAQNLQYLTGGSQEAQDCPEPPMQWSSRDIRDHLLSWHWLFSWPEEERRGGRVATHTQRVTLWKLDKDRLILTPHSTHSSHMTLPTAPVLAVFTGRSLGPAVPSLTATQKAGCLPSDSDMERARLLKPSDRLQMPDFSLSSE